MSKKIALISAFISNTNDSEISFTSECEKELKEYGVDIFRFNNTNVNLLEPHLIPTIKKEDVYKQNRIEKLKYNFNAKYRFKQSQRPAPENDYTRLIAKIPKVLFYKVVPNNYDYYIWCDSKFILDEHWLKYVLFLIEKHSQKEVIVSTHSERTSIKQELDFMISHMKKYKLASLCSKYNMVDMHFQVNNYLKTSQFKDNGLYELTMIIYSKKILKKVAFLEEWYAHNYYYTIQDQLSFPYLIQKYHVDLFGVRQDVFNMPFVKHREYGI